MLQPKVHTAAVALGWVLGLMVGPFLSFDRPSMKKFIFGALFVLTAAGCTTTDQRVGGAAVGAGIGLIAGPVGAVAGGAVGAAAGPAVSRSVGRATR